MAADPSETPSTLTPSPKLVADRAYVELRDRIVTLNIAPGTVLR